MSQLDFRKYFSPQAIQVVQYATVECMRMKHDRVGPEHLVLGLLMASNGEAHKLLAKQSLPLSRARLKVDLMHGSRDYISLEPQLTVASKRTLYLAWQHAMLLGGDVETEHILLAMLKKRDGNTNALRLLKQLRVDLGLLYADLMKLLESKRSGNNYARYLRKPDEENGEVNE